MNALQKKQLEVLNETIAAYNINSRCVDYYGACKYHVDGKQGCAVGRLIPNVKLKKKLDGELDTNVDGVFDLLPKKVQKLSEPFLTHLQSLHDCEGNWNKKGLSREGKKQVKKIKETFDLN